MNAYPGHGPSSRIESGPSRRSFLRNTTRGTIVAVGSGLGMEFALPSLALAQNPSNPDAALRELTAGNQRFTAGRLTAHEHDLDILKQHTIEQARTIRYGPFLRRFPCAGRVDFRSEYWTYLCHPDRRQLYYAGSHCEYRIWRCRARHQSDFGNGSQRMRCGEGGDPSQRSSGTNQCALFAYSAGGRPSRSEPRSGDKSERPDPGSSFTKSVDRRLGPPEGEQAEGDRSILRPRQWQS